MSSATALIREVIYWRGINVDYPRHYPSVTVIVPLRGVDQNLEENLKSIINQDYPGLVEYLFIVDDADDPAYPIASRIANVIIAGDTPYAGKGWALSVALGKARGDVVVFADSDIYVHRRWLRGLVSLLDGYGAVTSYRFYVPRSRLSLGILLKSSFNMIGITAMMNEGARFTWGGSTATWRWLLEKHRAREYLPYYLSDDYVINKIVRNEGLRVLFNPGALALTIEDCGVGEALAWASRQLWYVRVYGFRGFIIYGVTYTVYAITPLLYPLIPSPFSLICALPYVLGIIKDYVRMRGILRLNEEYRGRVGILASLLPLVSVINVYFTLLAIIKALVMDRIEWRGRIYTRRDALVMMHKYELA